MRALVYKGPRQMEIEEWPVPVPSAGEVRIKTRFVGICGSDVHGFLGTTGRRTPPMVMGHELSGVVSAIGPDVEGVKAGDRVTVQPILNCGKCGYCQSGSINICPYREFLGVMSTNGALEEEFCVPARNVCRLPDDIDDEVGALVEPFAVGFRAVAQAQPVKGKIAMICGSGTIGLMILKILKLFEVSKVIMIDINDERLELAKRHGADITINPAADSIAERLVQAGVRESIDISFEAVGMTATVQQSVDYVRNQGLVIWVGNSAPMVTLNMQNVVTRELRIQGTYVYTMEDFQDSIRLISDRKVDFSGIISKSVPLDQAAHYFDKLSEGSSAMIKVLVDVTK